MTRTRMTSNSRTTGDDGGDEEAMRKPKQRGPRQWGMPTTMRTMAGQQGSGQDDEMTEDKGTMTTGDNEDDEWDRDHDNPK